jgi:tetratricopeptide (TPR) repeat protein
MKIKLVKKFTKLDFSKKTFFKTAALVSSSAVFILMTLFFVGCTPQADKLYNEAYREIESGHFRIALSLLERSAELETNDKKKTKALTEAARISRFEIQDFDHALRIYRQIILKSQDPRQRFNAQDSLAEIYLENLQNYSQALKELQILEQLDVGPELKEKTKLKIAQAQFLSGNSVAALEYIDAATSKNVSDKKPFLKLKAQALLSLKKYDDALAAYEEIRRLDDRYFASENLYIAASIVFEEKEDYASAINYLEKYQDQIPDKAYYELRIKRLKEKLVNKPLFKGRRK